MTKAKITRVGGSYAVRVLVDGVYIGVVYGDVTICPRGAKAYMLCLKNNSDPRLAMLHCDILEGGR